MHSFLTPSDPKFAHSIPRRPLIKIYASHLNPTGFRAADAAGAFGLDLFAKKTRLPHKLPGRREKANRRATGKRKFVDRRIAPQEIAAMLPAHTIAEITTNLPAGAVGVLKGDSDVQPRIASNQRCLRYFTIQIAPDFGHLVK